MLLAKGYPDIGWNPIGGERYLDFLRFAVFVNGESGVGGGGATGGRGPPPSQPPSGCGPRPGSAGIPPGGLGQGPEASGGPGLTLEVLGPGLPGQGPRGSGS